MNEKVDRDIQYVKGVGEVRAKRFRRLGVDTLMALLRFYPRAYEDWSHIHAMADAPEGEVCCVEGIIAEPPEERRIGGGRLLVKTEATDGETLLRLVFFNNRYAADALREGEAYLFYGKTERDPYSGQRQMISPQYRKKGAAPLSMQPIYHQTDKLPSKTIARCVRAALDTAGDLLPETLPSWMLEKYKLLPLQAALEAIHFPRSEADVAAARRRLAFEELLTLETGLLMQREKEKKGIVIGDYSAAFEALLPFTMTGAQVRAVQTLAADMASGGVMRRLLQGDVGSGKTAVAAAAVYSCVKSGCQAAVMAPTEVLAGQHFRTFLKFFENTEIRTAILSGSMSKKSKDEVKQQLAEGHIDCVIGTHALIQQDVVFHRLGLVITDEQHRFGVGQRAALANKGADPHLLVMSATPIPRTLGLIIYGDMDLSILDELPKGRKPVKTYLVDESYRPRLYRFLEKHFAKGQQGYIICPLVEQGGQESLLMPAEEYYAYLQREVFPDRRLGLLHGKMKPAEKERVMRQFSEGELDCLVATTVVEVGVDVPNATVMLIENADRFGLSQLHQLRGRVGRGQESSTCVLISGSRSPKTQERLAILCATTDGFRIADEDLRLRGPGDFFGQRQHGLPELKIADLCEDTRILRAAREIAEKLLAEDPALQKEENRRLRDAVVEMFRSTGA